MRSFSILSRAVAGIALASLTLSSALAAAPAPAAEAALAAAPAPPGQPTVVRESGDWVARCFPVATASPCDMFQELADRETKQKVLGISIAFIPSSGRYAIQISVPLGVALANGAVVSMGSYNSPAMKFRRCDRGGCYVETLLDATILDKMAASGNEGVIKIVANNDKPFPIKFSLNGFSGAREAMMEAARQKAKAPVAPAK